MSRSRSACAFASTSRFRIFEAPATARSATWLRSCSFARATSCSISAFAAAMMRSPSVFASDLAASIVSSLNFSPTATISAALPLASASMSATRFSALARFLRPS